MTIQFKPVNKIIIRSITEQSFEHFIHNQVMAQTPFVFWWDGILLTITGSTDDTHITKNYENNIEEITYVIYTKLKDFPIEGIKHQLSGFILSVLYGESATLKEIVEYLKKEYTY